MTWSIDEPVHTAGVVCAAIVETSIDVRGTVKRLGGYGRKRPLLFLIKAGDRVVGYDCAGTACSEEIIEARFPKALDRFAEATLEPPGLD